MDNSDATAKPPSLQELAFKHVLSTRTAEQITSAFANHRLLKDLGPLRKLITEAQELDKRQNNLQLSLPKIHPSLRVPFENDQITLVKHSVDIDLTSNNGDFHHNEKEFHTLFSVKPQNAPHCNLKIDYSTDEMSWQGRQWVANRHTSITIQYRDIPPMNLYKMYYLDGEDHSSNESCKADMAVAHLLWLLVGVPLQQDLIEQLQRYFHLGMEDDDDDGDDVWYA
ncbi:hypothetical protein HDV00_000937 [Rhizophlyctis rosea]|nr:hypothetical protein HDV00_000937 [Rhizophlyctis rosea]